MRNLKIIFLSLGMMINCSILHAQTWMSLDDSPDNTAPTFQILESTSSKYVVKVTIHGFNSEEVVEEGVSYKKISIEDCYTLSNIGEPALPITIQQVGLPTGDDCSYTITDEKWQDVKSIGRVYPFQKLLLEDEESSEFAVSDSIYNSSVYDSELVSRSEKMNFRGLENFKFSICPFKYYPSKGSLSVLSEFIFTVTFKESTSSFSRMRKLGISGNGNIFHLFDNSQALVSAHSMDKSRNKVYSNENYNYLIIVGDNPEIEESKALKDFCLWKAYKGFRTKVVSTRDIGNDCSSIKNYIKEEYTKGVDYVLFIGDNDKIPLYERKAKANIRNITKSDYWYGAFDGENDSQTEVCIGRFSIEALSEFENMVHKTINYESISGNCYNDVLLIAHKEDAPQKYQRCCEEIVETLYDKDIHFVKLYGSSPDKGGNNAINDSVIDRINSGFNIVSYRGHGDYDKWEKGWSSDTVGFQINHVLCLKNEIYPIVFSIACQNGNIKKQDCLLEAFMRSTHGSAAFIGSTENSYTIVNHYYNKLLFEQLFNNNIFNIGYSNAIAHTLSVFKYGSTAYDNAYSYILGNDPALEIWTEFPKKFDKISINRENGIVTINTGDVNDYEVSLISSTGELLETIHSDVENIILNDIDDDCAIAINKHDYVPYIENPNETLYIQNEIVNDDKTYKARNICVGSDVTKMKSSGNVCFSGSNIIMDCETIELNVGTSIEKGTEFEIKIKE